MIENLVTAAIGAWIAACLWLTYIYVVIHL